MKKRTKKWHRLCQYGALYLLLQFFLLAYLQVACQSENALQREPSVRVAITEQNAESLQVLLLQNTYTIPTQIQETTLPIPVFAPEDGCRCICSGSCCNPAKFEKQKKCTAYFSTVHIVYQAENALQREPSVRVAITEQNAEALQGSLLQNTDTIPTQYKKQRYLFQFLHRRTAVCCICSGNYCNQAKFEYAGIESSSC